ncbi:MAG: 2-phosphosulfolactate phosphatase, partial [Flavobacteriales bacterium]
MNRIEVCFSPGEYHLYESDFQLVVVLDVLRATSAICTAMEHGVKEIIPVATVEEARKYQAEGYIAAAERGGQIVEGF